MRSSGPGWYQNVAPFFSAPLLDTSVSDDALGAWLDAHTMKCHQHLLSRLDKVRSGPEGSSGGPVWVLDDPYQQRLESVSVEAEDL